MIATRRSPTFPVSMAQPLRNLLIVCAVLVPDVAGFHPFRLQRDAPCSVETKCTVLTEYHCCQTANRCCNKQVTSHSQCEAVKTGGFQNQGLKCMFQGDCPEGQVCCNHKSKYWLQLEDGECPRDFGGTIVSLSACDQLGNTRNSFGSSEKCCPGGYSGQCLLPEAPTTTPVTTPETTTKEPETTTKEPETTTKEPETTTKEPETTTKEPETTTKEPETTTKEPETTTKEPETTTKEPETTTKEPETTTKEPDTTTKEPEITTPPTQPTGSPVDDDLDDCDDDRETCGEETTTVP